MGNSARVYGDGRGGACDYVHGNEHGRGSDGDIHRNNRAGLAVHTLVLADGGIGIRGKSIRLYLGRHKEESRN